MILVIGLAGSGKSTQCRMLEATGRYKWLSVGQMLRARIEDPKSKAVMDRGDVLDDNLVLPLVSEYLSLHQASEIEVILDGFPRSLAQAKWLSELKDEHRIDITKVIHIRTSQEEALPRLLERGRTDDREAVIKERFSEYESVICKVLDYLRDQNIPIAEVEGNNSPEAVHKQIVAALQGAG